MGLNDAVIIGLILMILTDCDGGYAVVHIESTTLVLARLNASDVMKSIMSTMGKEISKRSEDGTKSIIQCSC